MNTMKTICYARLNPMIALVSLAALLSGCGGGSDATTVPLPTKSALQNTFEAAAIKTGSGYSYLDGTSTSTGTTSFFAVKHVLPTSPADASNKTVLAETTAQSLSAKLPVPISFTDGSGFYSMIVDETGALNKAVKSNNFNIIYDGDKVIQLQKTLTGTQGYFGSIDAITAIPLTGTTVLSGIQKQYPTAGVGIDAVKVFSANAGYYQIKLSRPRDQVFLFDWDDNDATNPGSVTPLKNGTVTKLEDGFPLTSNSDGVRYLLTDGDISTYNGKRIWIAKNKRPVSANPRTEYRVLMEVGGALYTGAMEKQGSIVKRRPDGAPADGSQDVDYFLYWNNQAIADIKGAVNF
jgi:hypothetical protein